MPIYEYQCCQCSKRFEAIHGVSEKEPKVVCPKCGASDPQRVVVSSFSCGESKGTESAPASACSPRPGRFS